MRILITGGAGYIGSQMVIELLGAGYHVTVVDDLSSGHREVVPADAALHVFNIHDAEKLHALFSGHHFDAVMHFASFILVGESVTNPAKYYRNNLINTINLLDTMIAHSIKHFIFSSTASIFGNPEYTPIDTKHPTNPINAYGQSKLFVEKILKDYDRAYGLKSACLRYFNAAGADPLMRTGERHHPETHLIPLLLHVALGQRDHIQVFGRDYDTRDGTCIRDYIHVVDLCSAHHLALDYLFKKNESIQCNLGNGTGYSVQEVINAVESVTGRKIKTVDASKRVGDPAILIADAREAQKILGWKLQFSTLETIVSHAWRYAQR